jgi:hypothetical protein
MKYYELKKGTYRKQGIEEEEIWQIFMNIFNKGISKKTTSYKFGLIHSIIESIKTNPRKNTFAFTELFTPFTEVYWELVVKNHLYQITSSQVSTIYKILMKFIFQNPQYRDDDFEAVEADLKRELVENVLEKCSRNVLGALYGDSDEFFYSFSKTEKSLTINPTFRLFLVKYSSIIERVNKYQWLKFLSERNPTRLIDIGLLEGSKKHDYIYNFELFWRDICSTIEPGMTIFTFGRERPNEIVEISDNGILVKKTGEPTLVSMEIIKNAWLYLVNDGVLFRDEYDKASYRSSFICALFSRLDYIEENLEEKTSIKLKF